MGYGISTLEDLGRCVVVDVQLSPGVSSKPILDNVVARLQLPKYVLGEGDGRMKAG